MNHLYVCVKWNNVRRPVHKKVLHEWKEQIKSDNPTTSLSQNGKCFYIPDSLPLWIPLRELIKPTLSLIPIWGLSASGQDQNRSVCVCTPTHVHVCLEGGGGKISPVRDLCMTGNMWGVYTHALVHWIQTQACGGEMSLTLWTRKVRCKGFVTILLKITPQRLSWMQTGHLTPRESRMVPKAATGKLLLWNNTADKSRSGETSNVYWVSTTSWPDPLHEL